MFHNVNGQSQKANPWTIKPLKIGKIVNPETNKPLTGQPFSPKEIFVPNPDKPIVEVPWEFPTEMPDWSKMPKELPIGVPGHDVEFPGGPIVPDWSEAPMEFPYPNQFPDSIPSDLPGGPGYGNPGQVWLFS